MEKRYCTQMTQGTPSDKAKAETVARTRLIVPEWSTSQARVMSTQTTCCGAGFRKGGRLVASNGRQLGTLSKAARAVRSEVASSKPAGFECKSTIVMGSIKGRAEQRLQLAWLQVHLPADLGTGAARVRKAVL